MKQGFFEIVKNAALTADVYKMELSGDTSAVTAPGQFVNIKLEGKFLRRPISVNDCVEGLLTIIYKVVGEGTAQMAKMQSGEKLDILTGLGNGYDLADAGEHPVLLGGGVGVPPLYMLAKQLIAADKRVSVVLRLQPIFSSIATVASRPVIDPASQRHSITLHWAGERMFS